MSSNHACELLTSYFEKVDRLLVLGRGPSAVDVRIRPQDYDGVLVADPTYAFRDVYMGDPFAVLIGNLSTALPQTAERFLKTSPEERPLLLYTYLPCAPPLDFAAYNLPEPVPILPLLRKSGLYEYEPDVPYPTSGIFLTLLAAAFDKCCFVAGIDFYRHYSGMRYVGSGVGKGPCFWPDIHSEATEILHLQRAARRLGDRLKIVGVAGDVLASSEPK
jgi:hypothetical protein